LHLTDPAKIAVAAILPNESLAEASTWADEMRSNPSEFWQKQAGPYHYVTVPKGNYHMGLAPPQGDAYLALVFFTEELKDPASSLAEKQLALRFIIHIIGDLHQPLHAGNGKDRGGNDVKVRFFGKDTNLHRVWDTELLEKRNLSYSEWSQWLSVKITPQMRDQWQKASPIDWINESVRLRDTLYPQSSNLSWDYLYQHMPTVKLRLQQAGVRIASYLNEVYADEHQ
jgi:hypothetical protein